MSYYFPDPFAALKINFSLATEEGKRCGKLMADAVRAARANEPERDLLELKAIVERERQRCPGDETDYHLHYSGALRDIDLIRAGDRSFLLPEAQNLTVQQLLVGPCYRLIYDMLCNNQMCPVNLAVCTRFEDIIKTVQGNGRPFSLSTIGKIILISIFVLKKRKFLIKCVRNKK